MAWFHMDPCGDRRVDLNGRVARAAWKGILYNLLKFDFIIDISLTIFIKNASEESKEKPFSQKTKSKTFS